MARKSWSEVKAARMGSRAARAGYEHAQRAYELAERVQALREAQGMSQSELERIAGALDLDLVVDFANPSSGSARRAGKQTSRMP